MQLQATPSGTEVWAALIVQRNWQKYVAAWLAEPLVFEMRRAMTPGARMADERKAAKVQAAVREVRQAGRQRVSTINPITPERELRLGASVSSDTAQSLELIESAMMRRLEENHAVQVQAIAAQFEQLRESLRTAN